MRWGVRVLVFTAPPRTFWACPSLFLFLFLHVSVHTAHLNNLGAAVPWDAFDPRVRCPSNVRRVALRFAVIEFGPSETKNARRGLNRTRKERERGRGCVFVALAFETQPEFEEDDLVWQARCLRSRDLCLVTGIGNARAEPKKEKKKKSKALVKEESKATRSEPDFPRTRWSEG